MFGRGICEKYQSRDEKFPEPNGEGNLVSKLVFFANTPPKHDINMASSDRFVAVGEEEILYIISNIFAKPQVFYYLVSDAKIFDIIYQLSPLLELKLKYC
jgi:hypothetical protein